MDWAFIWLMIVLKIPLAAALWIIWWSIRSEPVTDDDERTERGGPGGGHPRPHRPRSPRRGPHVERPPGPPSRVRARPRQLPARARR